MLIVTASAAILLAQAAKDKIPDDYWQLNSEYARACAAAAASPSGQGLLTCNKALESEPLNRLGQAQTLTNRAVIRLALNDSTGALADYNAALDKAPELAAAYTGRAWVHLQRREFEAAREDADHAVTLDGKSARAFYVRGGANEMLGKTTDAYRDYQTAAKLDPNWAAPKTELARFKAK
jgi:tetratricopeptide (TPR) repeat protein